MDQNFKAFQHEASEQPDLADYVPGHWTRSPVKVPSNPNYSMIGIVILKFMGILIFSC